MNASIQEKIRKSLSLYHQISEVTATALAEHTRIRQFKNEDIIEKENQIVFSELVVLDGILRSYLIDSNGKDITTNFFQKGMAVTPTLMRTLDDKAFHSFQVISPQASFLAFNKKGMFEHLDNYKDLEMFGYRVMMVDAFYRAEREVVSWIISWAPAFLRN
ncbi:MAG: hypothetical protein IPL49_11070 [Saprospirales bacterium]|nr:hypothetical protein [Saprospirales bacterium]